MSIQFDEPLNSEQQKVMNNILYPHVITSDERQALLDTTVIQQTQMRELARKMHQVVVVEVDELGEIKTMSDGTKYQATKEGWVKL